MDLRRTRWEAGGPISRKEIEGLGQGRGAGHREKGMHERNMLETSVIRTNGLDGVAWRVSGQAVCPAGACACLGEHKQSWLGCKCSLPRQRGGQSSLSAPFPDRAVYPGLKEAVGTSETFKQC